MKKANSSDFLKLLGEHIMVLRKRKDWNQTEFADKLGIGLAQVGRIERGTANCSINTLIKIADLFGISVSELVNVIETPSQKSNKN